MHVGCLVKPSERFSQKSNESRFFRPFGQRKMRQFGIGVALESVQLYVATSTSPSLPKDVAPYAHLYLPLMEFCLARRSPRWPPVYRSCFQVRSLSKTQATCVYRHSGPFIHKLAVLIQLQESSWTIQK